ncbi:bifunctional 4-hydroxy-2-oxoglutarate aldolase/2-dehydro-3-deoxy-phosphogluconate aldolase [Pseudoroseomonas cervicalis]|uniref:bifunctional 4-hydroxy-2-oxoglutarate aldolase/2-dehydro-3-deoxy-phosphogluconate aldolase n=1 Tax=Teichococcus cervicalis TaxID=204525 RepID=UPI0022F1ABCC|nr:bifunctional 4-hydroxy-2-oxoglutarate aldolase/2-dehydro-3-deoxy-phosphogluconate aldolase [Pseudoroseomonas cervicalis]WBV41460.1 bifunctional 4-hydroxy-2-oxoglutarate aldolase/2-dehydro-3-deoxy-phosphogluconate aldolase [Pseudoroseomonas cervicalis]
MTPHPLIDRFRAARIVPVVRTSTAQHAATACAWLREAGITIFEITLTIPDALSVIRELAADPALLVGAGTVPSAADAEACISAGARFIVSPWVDASLAAPCRNSGACLMMGALTPTEVRAARQAGADVVKIFPASSVGGPAHIKSLRAVFPGTAFCPTGGVDARNAGDYIAAGAAFVGIGGKLVDEAAIAAGKREVVQAAAREALGIAQA